MEIRSYSPKPISSKRKCSLCGKVKRISKCRKTLSSSTCPCGRKEFEKPAELEPDHKNSAITKSATSLIPENDHDFQKSASYSNTDEMKSRKMGKLFRSKVYDFKALQDSPTVNPAATKATGKPPDASSINVIVPTTRKIFAPLKQDENGGASAVVSYTIDESEDGRGVTGCDKVPSNRNTKSARTDEPMKAAPLELQTRIDKLPPASPLSTKRNFAKDNNSSIKMMIAHYNKLMSENAAKRSEAANCWSPTLQKSPVLERRNQFEHMKNNSQLTIRKSKSAVLSTKSTSKLVESPAERVKRENSQFAIAKCSSAGSLQYRAESFGSLKDCEPTSGTIVLSQSEEKVHQMLVEKTESKPPVAPPATPIDEAIRQPINPALSNTLLPLEHNSSFESILSETKLRNLRLQEAKKKFFDEHPSTKKVEDLPPEEEREFSLQGKNLRVENKRELEMVKSLGTESNFGLALNKSVSTGAIDDRRNCGVASSPSGEKSSAKSKFGFSSIASKFRKVKMRRHKEPEVSAISSLCRASLLMNLEKEGKSKDYLNGSKSCPSSPVMQRNMCKRNSSSN